MKKLITILLTLTGLKYAWQFKLLFTVFPEYLEPGNHEFFGNKFKVGYYDNWTMCVLPDLDWNKLIWIYL